MAVDNNMNFSNLLSSDLGATCLSYLTYPQLDRRIDEVFEEDPSTALAFYRQQLHSIYNMPDTSLVKRIYTIQSYKAPLQETSAQQARERTLAIREAAVSLIRQGAPLLSQDEWRQQPATPHSDDAVWTFEQIHQMGNAISERRAENLVRFFDWLRARPGIVVDPVFVERMGGNELTLRQKAHAIHLWLKENGPHLPLTAIDAGTLEGFREIPRELLYLPLDRGTLQTAFEKAAKKGFFGFISKLIKSHRFAELWPFDLGVPSNALEAACESGHFAIVQAIMESSRFSNYFAQTFDEALRLACTHGHIRIVQALMENPRFDRISGGQLGYLGTIFRDACNHEHLAVVISFIANRRFHDISAEDLGVAFARACEHGHLAVVQALMVSGRFHQISARDLGWALCDACDRGHLEVVRALIANDRFRDIRPPELFSAFKLAWLRRHHRVALKLFCTRRGGVVIPFLAPLSALEYGAQTVSSNPRRYFGGIVLLGLAAMTYRYREYFGGLLTGQINR